MLINVTHACPYTSIHIHVYCVYIYIWYMIYDIWYMIYDIKGIVIITSLLHPLTCSVSINMWSIEIATSIPMLEHGLLRKKHWNCCDDYTNINQPSPTNDPCSSSLAVPHPHIPTSHCSQKHSSICWVQSPIQGPPWMEEMIKAYGSSSFWQWKSDPWG